MLSRRHLLDRCNPAGRQRCHPAAPGRKPLRAPSSSTPCPMRRPRTSRISMPRPWRLHHGKHHAAYVNNLNAALAKNAEVAKMPLQEMLANLSEVPEAIRTAVRNNGGGHANHTMFWQIMGGSGGEPSGELKAAIDQRSRRLPEVPRAISTPRAASSSAPAGSSSRSPATASSPSSRSRTRTRR